MTAARRAGGAGYSGTPLAKKLGIGTGHRVWLVSAPVNYTSLVSPLPDGVSFAARPSDKTDMAHVFARERRDLEKRLRVARDTLKPDAVVWVSWPKKSSQVETDITEDVIREVALPMGFVDVKVCAVDETWSGLKLVVRKVLR
jgi:hypothetical protein